MGPSVSLGNTPRVIIGSRSPRNPISTGGPGFMQLSIKFDRVVRPAYDQPRSLRPPQKGRSPGNEVGYDIRILDKRSAWQTIDLIDEQPLSLVGSRRDES